jgi:cytochrome c-type biogenesis protein CcmE
MSSPRLWTIAAVAFCVAAVVELITDNLTLAIAFFALAGTMLAVGRSEQEKGRGRRDGAASG